MKNDNRNYDYEAFPEEANREEEYNFILQTVTEGSSAVDLGCGNGNLLQLLREKKKITTAGVEISESGVAVCQKKNLNVIQGSFDQRLPYPDNRFDYAICNVTMQMSLYPEVLLREMKRIAQYQIISFPNFAYFKNRLDLFFKGRMPRQGLFGYEWYNTGHIHQFSIADFRNLVRTVDGLEIIRQYPLSTGSGIVDLFRNVNGNLFQKIVFFVLKKRKNESN